MWEERSQGGFTWGTGGAGGGKNQFCAGHRGVRWALWGTREPSSSQGAPGASGAPWLLVVGPPAMGFSLCPPNPPMEGRLILPAPAEQGQARAWGARSPWLQRGSDPETSSPSHPLRRTWRPCPKGPHDTVRETPQNHRRGCPSPEKEPTRPSPSACNINT